MSASRLWIFSPKGSISGGPEALHQLAETARKLGIDARIVYFPQMPGGHAVPEPFQKYEVVVAAFAEDQPGDAVLVAETATFLLRKFKKSRRYIWWLSVDNYYKTIYPNPLRRLIERMLGTASLPLSKMKTAIHLAQSHYAARHLQKIGVSNWKMLTDFLNEDFVQKSRSCAVRGEGTVAYNPRKGMEHTRLIMTATNGRFRFIALEGMTPAQLMTTLQSTQVYIDFGEHPGRDRMPREAAMAGCCIVTNRAGSAAFTEDLPIPDDYKIDQNRARWVEKTLQLLSEIMLDFERHQSDFTSYRNVIESQKTVFASEVAKAFEHQFNSR